MRIELNAGGLGGVAAISGFHTDFSGLISKSKKMLAAFQVVKQQSYGMNGGVGNLQAAVNEIENRISVEENKVTAIETVEKKTNGFLELAIKTDIQASVQVNRNKNEFYRVNPWAKPPAPLKEKKWYQKAGDWLCKRGKEIVDGTRKVISWAGDTIKKIGKSIKEFCASDLGQLILGIVGVVGAVLLIVSIPALVPMLAAGLAWVGISSATAGVIASVIGATCLISTSLALIPNSIDTLAAADRVIGLGGGINEFNSSLHKSKAYNFFQKATNITSFVTSLPLAIAGIWGSFNGITAETARSINSGNYSTTEIRDLVKGFRAAKKAAPVVNKAKAENANKANAPKNKSISRAQETSFEKSMPKVDTQVKVTGSNSNVSTTLDGLNTQNGNILELKSSMTATYTKPQKTLFGVKNPSKVHPGFNVSHTTENLIVNGSGNILPKGTSVITIYQQSSYSGLGNISRLLIGPSMNFVGNR